MLREGLFSASPNYYIIYNVFNEWMELSMRNLSQLRKQRESTFNIYFS